MRFSPGSRTVVLLVAAALVSAACGTDDNIPAGERRAAGSTAPAGGGAPVECAAGTITGAGSTFVQTIVQQWIKDYGAACPDATVNYQGIGSGAGIQQFTEGTVDFGATDAVMKPDEQQAAEARGGPVLHLPWAAGAIAVMFNLEGVTDLQLSPDTVAAIFAGAIDRWDDPRIARDNRDVELPATAIQVVHRSDGSGTTHSFTSYLAAVAPAVWKAGAGKDVAWPTGQGAKGSDGVTAAVKQANGAIGYAELSFASANRLSVAKIRNPSGRFTAPSAEAVAAALADAKVPDDLKIEPNYAPEDPRAYAITTATWVLVYGKQRDPVKAKLVRSFLLYALGEGQESAAELFYAPLPRPIWVRAEAAVYGITG